MDVRQVLLVAEPKDDLYTYYKKLPLKSKLAIWSTLLIVTIGTGIGIWLLLRLKEGSGKSPGIVNDYSFVLSGGGDVCGTFSNTSSILGLNGSRWEPYTRIEFQEANMTEEVEWESCFTPSIKEGKAVITSYGNNQGYSINGTGFLIRTSYFTYNITFNVNATCDRYQLYMLSKDVANMTCRLTGNPLQSELSPEAAEKYEYFNLSFKNNKDFGRRDDDEVKAPYAIGDYDCYTSHDEVNNSYAYTMGRYEAVCNRSNFCEVNPRMFGYTCEDDTEAWPRTMPCIYNIYMRDCPLNNTNSTDDDYNVTDDDINNTVSMWQRLWKKPTLGRRGSLTLFKLPQGLVEAQEERQENHLRANMYV